MHKYNSGVMSQQPKNTGGTVSRLTTPQGSQKKQLEEVKQNTTLTDLETSGKNGISSSPQYKIPQICLFKDSRTINQQISPYFLNQTLLSSTFSPNVRSKMVLWFMEQSNNLCLPREVCGKAIALLDSYFMKGGQIVLDQLQELGISCLGVAWKLSERVGAIPIDEKNFSKSRILSFERKIVSLLKFRLSIPTVSAIALEFLHCWDIFILANSKLSSLLPSYFECLHDEQCWNVASAVRIDQIFGLLDICACIPKFLKFNPFEIVHNTLYYFANQYLKRPNATQTLTNEELKDLFDIFYKNFSRGPSHAKILERVQTYLGIVVSSLRRLREVEHKFQSDYFWNFKFQYDTKQAKEISLQDVYEKKHPGKLLRKPRNKSNIVELVTNFQMFKPYYAKLVRCLLKDIQHHSL